MARNYNLDEIREGVGCLCMGGFGIGLMVYYLIVIIKGYIKHHEPSLPAFVACLILFGICSPPIIIIFGGGFLNIYYQLNCPTSTTTTTDSSDKDRNIAQTQLHHQVVV